MRILRADPSRNRNRNRLQKELPLIHLCRMCRERRSVDLKLHGVIATGAPFIPNSEVHLKKGPVPDLYGRDGHDPRPLSVEARV